MELLSARVTNFIDFFKQGIAKVVVLGAWNDFLIRYGLRSEMTDADIEAYLMQDSICDHNCGCRYEHPQSSDTDFRSAIDCLLSMGYVVTLSKPFNNEEYAL